MTKFKLPLIALAVLLPLTVLAIAVFAQGEPPPPYADMQNPFSWSDASAQAAGKQTYQLSCLGCHGTTGNGVAGADFSTADYPKKLEARPDFYFWILSEGRLDRGMPPYKGSLIEQQRWQVLTYIHSLGGAAPPPPPPPGGEVGGSLSLSVPQQAETGQKLTLSAALLDKEGKSIPGATVKFFLPVDFFASGQMEIGEAVTNDQGVAVFDYTPRLSADTQVVASYQSLEATAPLSIADSGKVFYQTEAGIHLPALGPKVFIGPESALHLGEMGQAPTSALRLPGGLLSWLWLVVIALILIWATYFGVMYQVLRISVAGKTRGIDTRLVPRLVLIIVVALGLLLVLMFITGPYSHFHLPP